MRSHARYNRCSADIAFGDTCLYFLPFVLGKGEPTARFKRNHSNEFEKLLAEA